VSTKLVLPQPESGYNQENEAQTRRAIELAFLRQRSGGGGALQSRRTVTITTASLAAGEVEEGSIDFGAPGQDLLTLTTDRACRLRFYATAAGQTADLDRAYTTPPAAGLGYFLDAIWRTVHTKIMAPPVKLFNAEAPVSNTIYYTIENLSTATGAVTITAVVVSTEA
jgi:hypothetical protein